jgi:hemerythrin
MDRLEWKPQYSVGVAELDAQHQTLFELANRLIRLHDAGPTDKQFFIILNELVRYAETHFATEEELMRRHGYPDLAAHEEEHRKFVERVFALNQRLGSADRTLSFELLDFLKTWYIDHVLGDDRGYIPLLAGQRPAL